MNQEKADHTLPPGTYYACHKGEGFDIEGAESTVRQVEEAGSKLVAMFKKPPKTSRLVAMFQKTFLGGRGATWDRTPTDIARLEAEACAEALNKLEFIPDRYGDNVIVRR